MDETVILQLIKDRVGLRSTVRDSYITAIIQGVLSEMKNEQGLALDDANPAHLMFIVDFCTWRYQNRDSMEGMPRHLQFRFHNLIISVGGKS